MHFGTVHLESSQVVLSHKVEFELSRRRRCKSKTPVKFYRWNRHDSIRIVSKEDARRAKEVVGEACSKGVVHVETPTPQGSLARGGKRRSSGAGRRSTTSVTSLLSLSLPFTILRILTRVFHTMAARYARRRNGER